MVFLQTGMEVLVGESFGSVLMREDGCGLWVLFEILHIVGSVAPLECSQIASAPMLSFPEQILSKRFGEFGGQHVSPSCAWGER